MLTVLVCAVVLASCDSTRPDPFEGSPLLYVCNQDDATVSLINMKTNMLLETVDLREHGFSGNASPHHVDAAADGSFWYVSLIGANAVAKFNRKNELVATTPFEAPGMVDLSPDGRMLYVSHTMSIVDVPSTVAAIRTSDMALIEEVEVFLARPHGIIVHPEGGYAYTASLSSNRIAVINTGTQEADVVDQEGDTQMFVHFAPSPDGAVMYVTGQTSNTAQVLDVSNPAEPVPVGSIDVNAAPWHPVFTRNGEFVYFGNKAANTVTVIDASAREVADVIRHPALNNPHGAAVSGDGDYVYISNNGDRQSNSTVIVINTSTNEVDEVIEVGVYATGIGNAY